LLMSSQLWTLLWIPGQNTRCGNFTVCLEDTILFSTSIHCLLLLFSLPCRMWLGQCCCFYFNTKGHNITSVRIFSEGSPFDSLDKVRAHLLSASSFALWITFFS
jgi:hypothetical protein